MLRPITSVLLLAGTCLAQEFTDPFNYAPGTVVPGYTEQRGDWMVLPTADVQSSVLTTFQELTNDTYSDTDCCVDMVAKYDLPNGQLMYTGPLVRHSGAGSTATYFMIKLQDNAAPRDGFDTYYVYYYNGSGFSYVVSGSSGAISPPTTQARVRLQVIEEAGGVRVQTFIDTDMDGKWNITRNDLTTFGVGTSGRIGLCGYRNAIGDDLRYFNSTLYLADPPVRGTTARLLGRATPNLPFQGVCSLGHSIGLPLGGGRSLPIDYDPLLVVSLTTPAIFAFSGVTDAAGDYTMNFNIPSINQLAGLTVWCSAFTFPTSGFSFVDIAPDVEVTIQ